MKEPLRFRLAHKQTIYGITVGCFLCFKDERILYFGKLEEALRLIKELDPRRFSQIQQDVPKIWVVDTGGSFWASWDRKAQLIRIAPSFLETKDLWIAVIACVLVHEATHARLIRLDIGRKDQDMVQVERVCIKAERAFARRVPDNSMLLEWVDAHISDTWGEDAEKLFGPTAFAESNIALMRELRVPNWIINWKARRFKQLEEKRLKRLDDKKKPLAGKG